MDRLESQNEMLAGLLGEFPDTVIVLDASGRLQWGNRSAERLFDRSLHDSIGLAVLELSLIHI